jgi:hypothetical protein
MPAFFAEFRGQGGQIAGNERLGVTPRAGHHLQRLTWFTHSEQKEFITNLQSDNSENDANNPNHPGAHKSEKNN